MNKIYSIAYDLNSPGQNYKDLREVIEGYDHCKIMKSHYLVYTSLTVDQIYDKLEFCFDKNDYVFISEVNLNCKGWLDKDVCSWIEVRQITNC